MFYTVSNCTTRQITATVFLNDLAGNNTGLVQESKDHGRHFQAHTTLCLHISTLRLNKNRVNDTAPQQTQTSHINTLAGPLRFWGKEGKKEGKSAIDQICLSHPPTSCFNPLAGTSYITVPLFHLERDADLKQRLRDPNHLLVESKTDCIYIKKCFVCMFTVFYYRPDFEGGVV